MDSIHIDWDISSLDKQTVPLFLFSSASPRRCVSQLLSFVFYQAIQLLVIRLIRVIRGQNNLPQIQER
jgi:hypothetical protein